MRSVSALAQMHAATWGDRALLHEASERLHARAGYWTSDQREGKDVQLCEANWVGVCVERVLSFERTMSHPTPLPLFLSLKAVFLAAFGETWERDNEKGGVREFMESRDGRNLGKRLAQTHTKVEARMTSTWDDRNACLCHGDAKAFNMFFDHDRTAEAGADGSRRQAHGVSLIDFQWTGAITHN